MRAVASVDEGNDRRFTWVLCIECGSMGCDVTGHDFLPLDAGGALLCPACFEQAAAERGDDEHYLAQLDKAEEMRVCADEADRLVDEATEEASQARRAADWLVEEAERTKVERARARQVERARRRRGGP